MNDYQRQRLYRAEQSVRRNHSVGKHFAFTSNVQAYVTALEDSAWFKAQFPNVKRRIRVDVNRRTKAYARGGHGTITLPHDKTARWAWNEIVVLHEVAHNLTPEPSWKSCEDVKHTGRGGAATCIGRHYVSCAAHGPEFAGIFLALVYAKMGREAGDALRNAFALAKVKVMDTVAAVDELPRVRKRVEVGQIIQRRVAKETGTTVTVTRGPDGEGWYMKCNDHDVTENIKNRLDAEAHAAHPSEWCPQCAAIVASR